MQDDQGDLVNKMRLKTAQAGQPGRDRVSADGVVHPRVIYWNNIPAPYMVDRFNAVIERDRVSLECWFNARSEADRSWTVDESEWRYPFRYARVVRFGGHVLGLPPRMPDGRRDDLLVSLYSEPSFVLGWALAKLRGVKTAFWVEVTFDAWIRRSPWKEGIKRFLFKRVDGILTAGEQGRQFALRYGADPETIVVLPHVVDVAGISVAADAVRGSREQRRSERGLRGATFLYVGRIWAGKGLDVLLDAYKLTFERLDGDASLVVVGDGVDEERLHARCLKEAIQRVVFTGFKSADELPAWYVDSDIFVFPTLGDPWGLVVEEAMACGLPAISSDAAGEIRSRIFDGENGLIVDAGEVEALADAMVRLARDEVLRADMGAKARKSVRAHTLDEWAERFENAVRFLSGSDTSDRR